LLEVQNRAMLLIRVNDYLFVHEDQIVKYLADYLSNDEYSLGCFADWFISSQTGIDQGAIAAMQAEEAFEACSKLILSICDMKEFAQFAISTDGAGHFLSRYDGSEKQIGSYLAFRQN